MADPTVRYELYGGPLDGHLVDFSDRGADLQLDNFGFIVVASTCHSRWLRYKRVELTCPPAPIMATRPWPYRFDGWVGGPL